MKKIKKFIIQINNIFHACCDRYFDFYLRLDTSKPVSLVSLDLTFKEKQNARRYQTSRTLIFLKTFKKLNIDFSKFIFIDLGSGKGKPLLLATRFGFKKCIGVEASKNLVDISNKNLAKYIDKNPQHTEKIEVVKKNARHYLFPEGDKVIYLFNPFDKVILSDLLENLINSKRNNPKDRVLIAYTNPIQHRLLETTDGCRKFLSYSHINHNNCTSFYEIL